MNIVSVASEMLPAPPVKGGAVETWIYQVSKRLASTHNMHILSVHDPLLDSLGSIQEGVHLKSFKGNLLSKLMLCTYKLPFKNEKSTLHYWPYVNWCAQYCRQVKADIIHVHSRPQFIPILRKANPGAKIISHVHNVSVFDIDGYIYPNKVFDQTDVLTACSDYLREEAQKRYANLTGKAQTLYNGVDLEDFVPENVSSQAVDALRLKYNIKPDEKIVLYAGRLVEYKGVHVLIEAFKEMLKKHPKTKLLLLGGHSYSTVNKTSYIERLESLAEDIKDQIIFAGYVPHNELPVHLKMSEMFVIPSLWEEPFGMVIIEGMAMKKPVVSFARGGIKEIITHKKDGLLLQDAKPAVLAEAMLSIMDDKDFAQKIGESARRTVEEHFSWEKITADAEDLYQDLKRRA